MNCQNCPFLNKEIDRIIISTIKRYREETGEISKFIYRTEVLNEHSITKLMRAERRGELTKIKNGFRTSKVKYLRVEYDNWNQTNNL